ncbi:MAG: GPR endopeptidase [Clostridia bacterium]|nr:GPR endopeptidase [Clostridia bacterium]
MNFRTDLALERREAFGSDIPRGVKSSEYKKGGTEFTKIRVIDKDGEKALGKPVGTYITAEIEPLTRRNSADAKLIEVIAQEIRSVLPQEGTVLVVGLGNRDITPDAVGPKSIDMLLATRHIGAEVSKSVGLGELRPVAGFVPGVLGKTGLETAESVKGLVKMINPCAVAAVDALAARRLSRLGNTVQISDTGIAPGSGVGNRRYALTRETVGVPVISVGVPTVVDASTLAEELSGSDIKKSEEGENMIVTPREIDLVTQRAAEIIGLSLNKAFQPHLSVDDIMMLVGN